MRLKKRQVIFMLAIFGLMILLVACNDPVAIYGPEGTPTWVSYDEWLLIMNMTDMPKTQQAQWGTFTPTPTATTTATMTPTATITPSPTATPIPPFNGYLLVNNHTGDRIKQAEFQPDCGGTWGMPGVDIWQVINDVPTVKICSTPWNRPYEWAINAAIGIFGALIAFLIILMVGNEIRKMRNAKILRQRSAALSIAPAVQTRLPARAVDEVTEFIQHVGQVDKGLAFQALLFRNKHRSEVHGKPFDHFAKLMVDEDDQLFYRIQIALQKAQKEMTK